MDKKIMDTQELREIRALIGDLDETPPAPTPPQPPAPQPPRTPPRQAARPPAPEAPPRKAAPPRRPPNAAQPADRPVQTAAHHPAQTAARHPVQTADRPVQAAAHHPAQTAARHPVQTADRPAQAAAHHPAQAARPAAPPPGRAARPPQHRPPAARPPQGAARPSAPPRPQRRDPIVPPPPTPPRSDAYNLEEILSEVSGVVERGASEKAQESHRTRKVRKVPEEHPQARPPRPGGAPRVQPHPKRKPARMEEEDDDEYEEISEREERREAKRAHQEAERERRRAEKEAKRISTEEDEEIVIRQPRQAQATCARRAKSLAGRSILVAAMGAAALYLTLADGFGLPLPDAVRFSTQPTAAVLALLAAQFVAMFAAIDVVGLGFYNLFSAKPDRRTLVSVAQLASLLHGLTIILAPAWNAYLPYCAVSIVLLFAVMMEEKNRLSARCRVFKAVSLSDTPLLVYSHLDPEDRPRRALKYQRQDNTEFLRELEKPDYAERFSTFYVPIALAAAVVFSCISAFGNGDPSRFFLAFSVMLSVGAPLGILCAAGKPYKNVSRRLLGDGAAIAGARGAQRLRAAKEIVLNDADLFPSGSISIESINNFGIYTDEKLLAYAAAITGGEQLELGNVFADALHRSYGRPVRATRILRYESGGMSADIGGDSVMLGTAAFIARMGIRTREANGAESGIFLVVNSYPAGIFNLQYHPSTQAYGGLHALRRIGMTPVIAAMDFNISPAMVASLFELKQGAVGEVPSDRADLYRDPNYVEGDLPGALLSRDSITPYANIFLCADKLAGVVRSNLILGGFAGVSGMLIMFYLTYLAEFAAISPQNVLMYLLLWYIPVLFITYGTRRLD